MPIPDLSSYSGSSITTIDQSDPRLQQYGGLTVSPDLAAQLAQLQQNGYMVGQDPFNGVPVPQAGDSLLDFTARLTFAGQPQWAQDIAEMNGIPRQDFTGLMQTINDATAKGQPYVWDKLGGVGNYAAEHPAVYLAPAAIAGAIGAFGGAAAGGAGAAAPVAGAAPAVTAAPSALDTILGNIGGIASGTAPASAYTGLASGIGGATGGAVAGGIAGEAGGVAGGAAGAAGAGVANALGSAAPAWVGNYLLPGLNTLIGTNAVNNATDASTAASQAAIDENKRQYDQTRTDLVPWLNAGTAALGQLSDPNKNFQASPDYAFRRTEGTRGIGNSFASRGGAFSGNAMKALDEFNSNLASGEFGNWYNRQSNLAGLGQTTANDLGQYGSNSATRTGNYLNNIGDARSSGILNRSGIIAGNINQGYRNYLYGTRP